MIRREKSRKELVYEMIYITVQSIQQNLTSLLGVREGSLLGDLEGDEVGEFVVGTSSSVVTVMLFMLGPAVLGPAVILILLVAPGLHGI